MENDPFIVDLPIERVIFYSYVKLPEGNWRKKEKQTLHAGWCLQLQVGYKPPMN